MDDQLSQGYFPVMGTGRDGSVVAVSATEGILSMEPMRKFGEHEQRIGHAIDLDDSKRFTWRPEFLRAPFLLMGWVIRKATAKTIVRVIPIEARNLLLVKFN